VTSTSLTVVAVLLYLTASALYLLHIYGRGRRIAIVAHVVLGAAAAAQLAGIGVMCTAGFPPVRDMRELLPLVSWLLVGLYLLASLRYAVGALGAPVALGSALLLLLAKLVPHARTPVHLRLLGELHILLATVGAAAFALAALSATLYLVQEARLRNKRFGLLLFRRTPPLETLDALEHRAVAFGMPIFTAALISGGAWADSSEGLRPEYLIAALTWLVFFVLLVARYRSGWRGRPAALLTLMGFGSCALVLAIYLARSLAS
jgi:ABC-type uncharacterized transport system permease subunit